MDIATIIGLVSFFTLIFLGMGDLFFFVNVPAILIVIGGTTALTLVSFPLADVVGLFGYIKYALLPPKPDVDQDRVVREMEKGIFMLGRIKTFAQVTGWLGMFIGVVLTLNNMDDPTKIGPGVALALLTPLYGIILAHALCWPLCTKLEVYLSELKNAGRGADRQ